MAPSLRISKRRARRASRGRPMRFEGLETRTLLAADGFVDYILADNEDSLNVDPFDWVF